MRVLTLIAIFFGPYINVAQANKNTVTSTACYGEAAHLGSKIVFEQKVGLVPIAAKIDALSVTFIEKTSGSNANDEVFSHFTYLVHTSLQTGGKINQIFIRLKLDGGSNCSLVDFKVFE